MWGMPDTFTGGTVRRATRGTRRNRRKYNTLRRKRQARTLGKALARKR